MDGLRAQEAAERERVQREVSSQDPACWLWPVAAEHRERVSQIGRCEDQSEAWWLAMRLIRDWQQGRCAICGGTAEVTDHDHDTGLVRGRLCRCCNMLEAFASEPVNPCVKYRDRNPAAMLGIQVRYYSPFTGWAEPACPPKPLSESAAYVLATRYGARPAESNG